MSTPWNDLLIRDSLLDQGTIPSGQDVYFSPDIICTQQNSYLDPTGQFGTAASYASNALNLPPIAQNFNYFYIRAKNMNPNATGGQVYAYICEPSLAMIPANWFNNPLFVQPPSIGPIVPAKQYYGNLPAVPNGGISVTPFPLIWETPADTTHFCAVAICSTAANPWNSTTPPTFGSWGDFVNWVRNHPTAGWRNLQLISTPNAPAQSSTASFNNTFSTPVTLVITVTCTNVPAGSTLSVTSAAMPGINRSQPVVAGTTIYYGNTVTCPPHCIGYVNTSVQLPAGTTWPPGAILTSYASVGELPTHTAARFDAQLGPHMLDRSHPALAAFGDNAIITVGSNTIALGAPDEAAGDLEAEVDQVQNVVENGFGS
jgi:hypothetical protein